MTKWLTDTAASTRFPVYTRSNASDVLPDPVSPLAATLSWVPGIMEGWRDGNVSNGAFAMEELTGEGIIPTCGLFNGYFYVNASVVRVFGERSGAGAAGIDAAFFGNRPDTPPYVAHPDDLSDAAGARMGLANRNNARRELRAPHAGVVLHVWKRLGESVDGTTTTPVAEIADLTTLELHAQVPPAELARVRDGMPATVTLLGIEGALPAKVARVAPAVDPATLLGGLRIQIEGTHTITVGSAANGRVVVATHPGLVVPADAVRRSMVGADEVVVCDTGVARVRAVTVGQRTETTAEIAKGITAGEQIVIDHVLGLEEGQKLTAPGAK